MESFEAAGSSYGFVVTLSQATGRVERTNGNAVSSGTHIFGYSITIHDKPILRMNDNLVYGPSCSVVLVIPFVTVRSPDAHREDVTSFQDRFLPPTSSSGARVSFPVSRLSILVFDRDLW